MLLMQQNRCSLYPSKRIQIFVDMSVSKALSCFIIFYIFQILLQLSTSLKGLTFMIAEYSATTRNLFKKINFTISRLILIHIITIDKLNLDCVSTTTKSPCQKYNLELNNRNLANHF